MQTAGVGVDEGASELVLSLTCALLPGAPTQPATALLPGAPACPEPSRPHLCEHIHVVAVAPLVHLDHSVNDGDVSAIDVEHHNLSGAGERGGGGEGGKRGGGG